MRISDPHFLPHMGCELDLEIKDGDVFTIIGENGIGKSTLVQRIFRDHGSNMCLVEQKAMDFFYDRSLSKIKSIFQHQDIDQVKFESYWETFQLHLKENRFQSTLSGGESQALKLCLGLSVKKDFYLLDEPSQYLDENSRKNLNQILTDLVKEKKSLLIVEHDLSWLTIPKTVTEVINKEGVLIRGKTWTT
jgi:ABC-type multidrug transport system ATPase subunit